MLPVLIVGVGVDIDGASDVAVIDEGEGVALPVGPSYKSLQYNGGQFSRDEVGNVGGAGRC